MFLHKHISISRYWYATELLAPSTAAHDSDEFLHMISQEPGLNPSSFHVFIYKSLIILSNPHICVYLCIYIYIQYIYIFGSYLLDHKSCWLPGCSRKTRQFLFGDPPGRLHGGESVRIAALEDMNHDDPPTVKEHGTVDVPSGKRLHNYGKSPFFYG